ncbi:geranylgeranyl pyrophosphate synthase [Eurytemora carolleeae]|uniref:geranylgeranyl pyrophosphate synthase n=1 Tax=Eurytemora carolleeae TaxID=1294199 RepID=UPI000C78446F|nr:geranylgeranyl pyrophosphate synthase [Eurytemora carolleeae]|eukprot:XP_023334294.1 geranylgeranyl pyrophosphate synthase-like [Eurytemora affinis]
MICHFYFFRKMPNTVPNGDIPSIVKLAKANKSQKSKEDLPFSQSNSRAQDALLLEPYSHLLTVPGKNIRGKLMAGFNSWLQVPEEKLSVIGEIVQMLHNASLLLDDIEDSSILRRGLPVAHLIYGQASTINCANYVMFIGLEKCQTLGHPEATKVFTEQMLELHRGQGMEIYWRDNFICPSEEEYKIMITRKTGGLFNLAVRLMQLFATSSHDFSNFVKLLGLYFQIRDDYENLKSDDYASNKSFAEDLTEGKFSFPVLHAVSLECCQVKKFCIGLIEAAGSFQYTKGILSELESSILKEIEDIGGNKILRCVMDELHTWES